MKNMDRGAEILQDIFGELSESDVLASLIRHEISKIIIKHRMNLNLNQSDYAKEIGVTQGLISRWESGDYNFTVDKLAEIAVKMDLKLTNPLHDIRTTEKSGDEKNYFSVSNTTTSDIPVSTYSDATDMYDFGGIAS